MIALALLAGCVGSEILVPPTADQDPFLPQIAIEVAGVRRAIHLEILGEPDAPTILFLHGSGSDYRSWLFAEPLADRFQVVFWDQRGAGLSERIGRDEITWAASRAEIDAVARRFSPEAPVHLVGHSWGAMLAVDYLSHHPERVDRMVLIEPGPLTGRVMGQTFDQFFELDLAERVLNEQEWSSAFLGPADHERMDYAYLLTLRGTLVQYHCDPEHPPDWPLWRAGAYVEAIRQRRTRVAGEFVYDFAAGVAELDTPIRVVGTDCSALGTGFQSRWHLPLLPDGTELHTIEGAGHRVQAERPDLVLAEIEDFLIPPSEQP